MKFLKIEEMNKKFKKYELTSEQRHFEKLKRNILMLGTNYEVYLELKVTKIKNKEHYERSKN